MPTLTATEDIDTTQVATICNIIIRIVSHQLPVCNCTSLPWNSIHIHEYTYKISTSYFDVDSTSWFQRRVNFQTKRVFIKISTQHFDVDSTFSQRECAHWDAAVALKNNETRMLRKINSAFCSALQWMLG